MKSKFLITLVGLSAALSSISSAVTVSVAGFANTSVGLITIDQDNKAPFPPGEVSNLNGRVVATGTVIFVSVTTPLTGGTGAGSVYASMNTLLASTTSTIANFNTALNTLITAGNTLAPATNPGIIVGASRSFTNGIITTPSISGREGGSAGNSTYMFLVAEAAGFITGIGAYTGPAVPSIAGANTHNPTNSGDSLGVGTSVLSNATTAGPGVPFTQVISGYQLAAAVPEPSAALLGAFGALALLRRRRN